MDIWTVDVATANRLKLGRYGYLSYNRNIKKNNLNFLVGINATSSTGDGMGLTYKGFPSGELSSPGYANKVPTFSVNLVIVKVVCLVHWERSTIRMTISILPMLPFVSTAVLSLVRSKICPILFRVVSIESA